MEGPLYKEKLNAQLNRIGSLPEALQVAQIWSRIMSSSYWASQNMQRMENLVLFLYF